MGNHCNCRRLFWDDLMFGRCGCKCRDCHECRCKEKPKCDCDECCCKEKPKCDCEKCNCKEKPKYHCKHEGY
ncbi:hypothetical protein P4V93_29000 [Bacillus wiedmannii]|nr:hypothetical protein [Bacillus wiedmannii]